VTLLRIQKIRHSYVTANSEQSQPLSLVCMCVCPGPCGVHDYILVSVLNATAMQSFDAHPD